MFGVNRFSEGDFRRGLFALGLGGAALAAPVPGARVFGAALLTRVAAKVINSQRIASLTPVMFTSQTSRVYSVFDSGSAHKQALGYGLSSSLMRLIFDVVNAAAFVFATRSPLFSAVPLTALQVAPFLAAGAFASIFTPIVTTYFTQQTGTQFRRGNHLITEFSRAERFMNLLVLGAIAAARVRLGG